MSNKSQHAAQAPVLRVTEIQNSKKICGPQLRPWPHFRRHRECKALRLNSGKCFGHWILKFEICL
jgi:hypothetical protein